MNWEDYLKSIKGIDISIKLKLSELTWTQKMLDDLLKVWSPYFTRHTNEVPALRTSIVKLSLREQEISEQIDVLVEQKEKAEKLFDKLQHSMHTTIMIHRYIEGNSFDRIASGLGCGIRWVQRVHDKALEEFQNLYSERKVG